MRATTCMDTTQLKPPTPEQNESSAMICWIFLDTVGCLCSRGFARSDTRCGCKERCACVRTWKKGFPCAVISPGSSSSWISGRLEGHPPAEGVPGYPPFLEPDNRDKFDDGEICDDNPKPFLGPFGGFPGRGMEDFEDLLESLERSVDTVA